jgi:hypothetical protein
MCLIVREAEARLASTALIHFQVVFWLRSDALCPEAWHGRHLAIQAVPSASAMNLPALT